MSEPIVFVPDDCVDCGHQVHDGPCPGDPFDVPDSGPGGIEPHVPTGCRCGHPEFDDDGCGSTYGHLIANPNGTDPDEERLRDDD